MSRDKILRGVLALETDWGLRYVQLSLLQRVRLLWTFRNFHVLPQEVLSRHERALIDSLCRAGKFLANWSGHGDLSEYCIGKIERSVARKSVSSAPVNSADAGPSRARQAPSALSKAS